MTRRRFPSPRAASATPYATRRCPECDGRAAPIVRGYPDASLQLAAKLGHVVLGGCLVRGDGTDTRWRCTECEAEWR